MDIKSLLGTDDAAAHRRPSGPSSGWHATLASPERSSFTSHNQGIEHGLQHESRPPQLSSLQTINHQDVGYLQSPLHASASSSNQPSQYTARPMGRNSSPQQLHSSPSNPYQTSQHFPSDNRSSGGTPTNFNQGPSTPMTQTPSTSTPGSTTISNRQRPSSSHSASTPTSAQYASQAFFRESTQVYTAHSGPTNNPLSAQHVSPQSVTPLGPPSLRPRPNTDLHNPSAGHSSHSRSLSGELRSHQRTNDLPHSVFRSPSNDNPPFSRISSHESSIRRDREPSLSVSPKTKLANYTPQEQATEGRLPSGSPNGYRFSADSKSSNDFIEYDRRGQHVTPSTARRSTSMGIDSMLNAAPSVHTEDGRMNRVNTDNSHFNMSDVTSIDAKTSFTHSPQTPTAISRSSQASLNASQQPELAQNFITRSHSHSLSQQALNTPPTDHHRSKVAPRNPSTINMASSAAVNNRATQPSDTQAPFNIKLERSPELVSAPAPSSQPAKKKPRLGSPNDTPSTKSMDEEAKAVATTKDDVQLKKPKKPPRMPTPIFAQSVRKLTNTVGGGHTQDMNKPQRNQTPPNHLPVNGQVSANLPSLPQQSGHGALGPWEPTILNQIPADGLTKVVSDFLFLQVMQNQDVGVTPAGGGAGKGAVLEIEAKIGRLIDKNTMDRLRIPVMTETIFDRNDPNYRTNFESSMTEAQHRALNAFLNRALIATQAPKPTPQNPNPPPNQRVKMYYKHTRESDTFYDLSQSGLLALPSSLNINPRSNSKVKVRITRDQKSGKELAKIVKTRLADIDIYSPQNQVDWRISVNVEMDFQGDMRDLIEPDKKSGRGSDRNKDRMSYKHQAYQIDLTQVTPADASITTHKEHELEIEVSSEEVRKQGTLLQKGETNQFTELVSGFVDNVRTLAKQVPVDYVPPSVTG